MGGASSASLAGPQLGQGDSMRVFLLASHASSLCLLGKGINQTFFEIIPRFSRYRHGKCLVETKFGFLKRIDRFRD
jgi:hypothetical protein